MAMIGIISILSILQQLTVMLILWSAFSQVTGDDNRFDSPTHAGRYSGSSDDPQTRSNSSPSSISTVAGVEPETTVSTAQGHICANYDDQSSKVKKVDDSSGYPTTERGMPEGLARVADTRRKDCGAPSYCFALWVTNPLNKNQTTILKQGCWLRSEGLDCNAGTCIAKNEPKNNTHFCCCSGEMCNDKFMDGYNPTEHTTTTSTHSGPVAVAPDVLLYDLSNKKKTIVVALVSVLSVALVIVFTYLIYRLCLTPKPSSPQSSTVIRVEPEQEPALPHFNIEDLKIEDIIVRGRYSEVRKGWLGDQAVVVKTYQPHHRQYYYNEKNAFTSPFMDHENLVKFYGAKEQEDTDLHSIQYMIVTKYIPLGSLTSYLKHNTIDWYTLCHMCLGISRGLAHLHTDIQKGGLFKPAIAHRDVNTRNILVCPDLSCVIADLGFSVGMMGSKIIKNGVAENAEQASLADVGTLRYMAPEVFDGAVNLRDCEASLKQIDMYALGLVIWEIASRCVDLYQGAPVPEYQLPFQAEGGAHPTFEEMQVLVVKYKSRPKLPEVWKDSNPAVRSLKETIEDCWDTDAEARLTSLCVQERISDIAVLWVQGTKHRGVTPTLNATMNLPEARHNGHAGNLGCGVVSNGVTYIPSYVDRNNEANSISCAHTVISNGLAHAAGDSIEQDGVMAPLISNVGHLTHSSSADMSEGRIRSWLHDQSVSESTVDTILPQTPSMDEGSVIREPANISAQPAPQPPVKASNVMLAKNKAVILHPNQGRNPTVERNTHKRSDEELTISGNRLVGPGDQQNGCNRRSSVGAQSAPPNQSGGRNSYDGMDVIESSSLVQNDALNQHHIHPRNTPIPYLQNQVHGEGSEITSAAPNLTRPKLANISGNRSSYLRLQGDDSSPCYEHRDVGMQSKSLKHKLSKLIRPMDLGHKFSLLMFGGKHKKHQNSRSLGKSDVEAVPGYTNRLSGQYINSGLDASPVGRAHQNGPPNTPSCLNTEVEMINGTAVTRACSYTSPSLATHPQGLSTLQTRLSATNVMRMNVLGNSGNEELPSPSLFPRSGSSSGVSDPNLLAGGPQEEQVVPLQNLSASCSAKDYGSIHQAPLNQPNSLGHQLETSDRELTRSLQITNLNEIRQGGDTKSQTNMPMGSTSSELDQASSQPSSCSALDRGPGPDSSLSKVAMAPLHDVGMSCGVQTPQNRSITPLNGYCTNHIGKKNISDQLVCTASGLNTFVPVNHFTDTKGGNSIMLNIHVGEKSLSKEARGTRSSLKKSGQTTKPSSTRSVSRRSGSRGHGNDQSEMSQGRKLPESTKLSQSQSVTDLGWYKMLAQNEASQNGFCDKLWRDADSDKSFSLNKHRPKSLSLKGHNYGSSPMEPMSFSAHVPYQKVKDLNSSNKSSNQMVKQDENGTLPIVVPNITLDKSSPLFHSASIVDKQQGNNSAAPSVAVTSFWSSTNTSINNSSSNPSVMRNGDSNSMHVSGDTHSDSKISLTTSTSASNTSSDGNLAGTCNDAGKGTLAMKDRSDSSEKIRRRIKTPVSFKKGRLSLYDDRLMTQSLGMESLTSVCGGKEGSGGGDKTLFGLVDSNSQDLTLQDGHHKMIQSDSNLVL